MPWLLHGHRGGFSLAWGFGPSLSLGVHLIQALSSAEDGPYPWSKSEKDGAEQTLILAAPLFCRTVCTTAPQPFCTWVLLSCKPMRPSALSPAPTHHSTTSWTVLQRWVGPENPKEPAGPSGEMQGQTQKPQQSDPKSSCHTGLETALGWEVSPVWEHQEEMGLCSHSWPQLLFFFLYSSSPSSQPCCTSSMPSASTTNELSSAGFASTAWGLSQSRDAAVFHRGIPAPALSPTLWWQQLLFHITEGGILAQQCCVCACRDILCLAQQLHKGRDWVQASSCLPLCRSTKYRWPRKGK